MHSCGWEKQKQPDEFIACTRDYVPTLHELMLKPDSSGEKIYAEGLDEFRNEQLFDTYLLWKNQLWLQESGVKPIALR